MNIIDENQKWAKKNLLKFLFIYSMKLDKLNHSI